MRNFVDLDEVFKEPTEQELKEQLEKAEYIADEKRKNIKTDLSFFEYQRQVNEIYKEVNELSSKYRMIQTPVMEESDDHDRQECLMTFEEFKQCCEDGGFIDYDGYGKYGTLTHISKITVFASDITSGKFRTDFTNIYWYNK